MFWFDLLAGKCQYYMSQKAQDIETDKELSWTLMYIWSIIKRKDVTYCVYVPIFYALMFVFFFLSKYRIALPEYYKLKLKHTLVLKYTLVINLNNPFVQVQFYEKDR